MFAAYLVDRCLFSSIEVDGRGCVVEMLFFHILVFRLAIESIMLLWGSMVVW